MPGSQGQAAAPVFLATFLIYLRFWMCPFSIVAVESKAYAFYMDNHQKSSSPALEARMRLIAMLVYIADQKQKNLDTVERLFSRLMLRGKD